TADHFPTVQVPIGTYGRHNPGTLELDVKGEDGGVIESSQVSTANLVDNQYCEFQFSNIRGVEGKTLHLSLSFSPGSKEAMVAAYIPPGAPGIGFTFRIPAPADEFRVIYRDQNTGAVVWENPRATPRVFLAPEVETAASAEDALSRLKDIRDLTRSVVVDSGVQGQSDPDLTRSVVLD